MLLPGHKPCLPRKDSSCASNVNFSKTPTIVHSSSKIGLLSFRLPTRRTSPSRTTILVLNYLVTMSFRFNVDLSFNFPPPPPRSPTRISSAPDQDPDGGPQEIKRGFTGWLQTARRHPRYSLRLLYFITALAGLIIDNVVLVQPWLLLLLHCRRPPVGIGSCERLTPIITSRLFLVSLSLS